MEHYLGALEIGYNLLQHRLGWSQISPRSCQQKMTLEPLIEELVPFAQSCPVEALSNPKKGGLGRPGRLLNSGWY